MKKANVTLFVFFVAFACTIFGIMIGRHNPSGDFLISSNQGVQVISASELQRDSNAAGAYGLININTASASLLQSLPNIGETLSQRIIEYRTTNGDYEEIEDLLQVKGIGQMRLDQIRKYINVGG